MASKLAEFFIVYFIVVVAHFVELSYCFTFHSTVALDGTGNFVRVSDAIAAAPNFSRTRIYIHIKPGIYKEHVEVPSQKTFIALIGDNSATTRIVDNRRNGSVYSTASSATLVVNGGNFMAQFLTFENSAGPSNNDPAVAVLDQAKYTSYYKCVFLGYQDTLYAGGVPQFFRECDIYGSIDFIFGNGLVVFQDCKIYARLSGIEITVTAQSKYSENDRSGFVFDNCNVTISPEIASSREKAVVYLGRPWRTYSMVVFVESYLDNVVQPKGWIEWPGVAVNNLFYAEFNNKGAGADTSRRVNWPGYHVLRNPREVQKFTVGNFIDGNRWLPETGIPFRTGL